MRWVQRPATLRWAAVVVLPVAAALIVLSEKLVTNSRRQGLSGTAVHVIQLVIVLVALILSSPLLAWIAKRVVAGVALLGGTLWLIYSTVIYGGHRGWWSSPIKPEANILLENFAALTFYLGVLLVLGILIMVVRGRRTFPRSTGGSDPLPDGQRGLSADEVDKQVARSMEADSQRQLDALEREREQQKIWGDRD